MITTCLPCRFRSLLIAAACLPVLASAETQSSFEVSATIQPGCQVDGLGAEGDAGTVSRLDFGVDTTLSVATRTADATLSQTITLRCTPGVALQMRIDGGQHGQGGLRHLQLGATADRLQYQIYRDPGFSQPIGIDQNQPITITTANMNNVVLPVYGQLTLPGNRPAGTYTDTLLVTLDW